jgi:hypothetical protein
MLFTHYAKGPQLITCW